MINGCDTVAMTYVERSSTSLFDLFTRSWIYTVVDGVERIVDGTSQRILVKSDTISEE